MNLSSLSVAASRLSQRMSEEIGELGLLDSLTASSTVRYWDMGELGMKETRRLLDGKSEKEKLEGVKRVLALMSLRGPNASLPFFPNILRSLSPQNSLSTSTISRSLHRLSSLYIIRHARLAPDLALLCVNSFQKDLGDADPVRRATAVRVLCSMVGDEGVEGLDGLLGVILSRAAKDASWYVRREAALSVVNVYSSTPSLVQTLREVLPPLLASPSPLAIPAALRAYETLYPNGKPELLHPHYKRYCRSILDAEPWGQTVILRVLAAYSRGEFRDPDIIQEKEGDLDLFLKAVEALLLSINDAVALCAAKTFYLLAPSNKLDVVSRTLLRLLHGSNEIQVLLLTDTTVFAKQRPEILIPYISEYYIRGSDNAREKALKLEILLSLTTESNVQNIMTELNEYLADPILTNLAIQAFGTIAIKIPSVLSSSLKTLVRLCSSKNESTVSQSVLVIQRLLASSAQSNNSDLIKRLASLLLSEKINVPTARANVLWLVGTHAQDPEVLDKIAVDVARLSVRKFVQETAPAKLQIITLVARLLVLSHLSSLPKHTRPLSLLFHYVTSLARYDLVYEVRDRARFLKGLLDSAGMTLSQKQIASVEEPTELDMQAFARGESIEKEEIEINVNQAIRAQDVKEVLFAAAQVARLEKDEGDKIRESMDTFYILTGKLLHPCSPLPPWRTAPSNATLRAEAEPPPSPSPVPSSSRTITPTGFGSDSFQKKNKSLAASPVILTPTDYSVSPAPVREFKNIKDFLGDESEESEEEDEDEDEDEDEEDDNDDDDEEDEEDEDEEEEEAEEELKPAK